MPKWKLEVAMLMFAGVAAMPFVAKAVTHTAQPDVATLRDSESRYRPGEPRTPSVRNLKDSEGRYQPGEPRR